MKIGIISAMDSEHRHLADKLLDRHTEGEGRFAYVTGRLGDNEVVLTQCGIGKVNAAMGASELIRRYAPDVIVSTGVAGGIDACLKVTDVVVSRELVYHDVWCGEGNAYGQVQGLPERYGGYTPLVEKALALNETGGLEGHVHAGLICTGDQFITDKAELQTIKAHFPQGLAVDMESAALAQVCHVHEVPFISFRIISDTPGIDNHWTQYKDFWGVMAERSFRTTWAFLTSI